MKRVYFLIPLLATAAFAGFDQTQQKRQREEIHAAQQQQAEARAFQIDPYANRDGQREASADLAQGKMGLMTFGLPVHWAPEYREILLRDHGIEYRTIAGCVVSEGLVKYAAAYNEVMRPRILARYGAKVFDEAAARAQALYAERHAPRAEP